MTILTQFEIIKVGITFFGIAIPLLFGVYQLKKRFDWDKAMLSYELGKIWTENTFQHRKVIEKVYGTYFLASKPINSPEPELFANASEGEEFYEIKIAVISLMNYLEDIAILYSSGMADKHIIDTTLRQPVLSYYNKIKPLSSCIDNVAGYPSWKPLDDLIKLWNQEDSNKSKLKPKKFF